MLVSTQNPTGKSTKLPSSDNYVMSKQGLAIISNHTSTHINALEEKSRLSHYIFSLLSASLAFFIGDPELEEVDLI